MNPPPQQQKNIDIRKFSQLKDQLDKMGEQRKVTKVQFDEIETQAIDALMQLGVRYVDESGNGGGPYWTLTKKTQEQKWKNSNYIEFFTGLLSEIQNGKRFTPDQCAEAAARYIKQFEKRRLQLAKLSQARLKTVDDLKAWLAGNGAE